LTLFLLKDASLSVQSKKYENPAISKSKSQDRSASENSRLISPSKDFLHQEEALVVAKFRIMDSNVSLKVLNMDIK